jgi:hypothetical protein
VRVVRVLAPFAIALVFSKMVSTMLVFHLHDITPPLGFLVGLSSKFKT